MTIPTKMVDQDTTKPLYNSLVQSWGLVQGKLAEEVEMRAQQGGDEVVMFGDSLMEAFRGTKFGSPAKLYQDYPNLLKAMADDLGVSIHVRAIAGDKTQNLVWRLLMGKEMQGVPPKVVTLLIGTNDLSYGISSGSVVKGGVDFLVKTLLSWAPERRTRVLLLGLFPRTFDVCIKYKQSLFPARRPLIPRGASQHAICPRSTMDVEKGFFYHHINTVNAGLEEIASKHPWVKYLDCTPRFLETDGDTTYLKPFFQRDGLHITTNQGAQEMLECMREPLRELLTASSAPSARVVAEQARLRRAATPKQATREVVYTEPTESTKGKSATYTVSYPSALMPQKH
eukprot:CAMPEP_0114268082 /NCGR_PEP_ID=MMETSP0058-20121206/25716_1 /TAXON_ID=36894 /ORGANISM="Pyramimonas parkeae, CCMP726" /LENGTH=340 /DNA_ID=CAMNT_0001386131 /DNA_START=269 /DNA_END=1291 /DNA_ORIENTATION=+